MYNDIFLLKYGDLKVAYTVVIHESISIIIKINFRFKIIIFPNIFPVISFCMGLGCALSMGDLGVITLFSFGDIQTLPLAIFRLMMSYKMDYAFSGSVLLIILCFLLFYLFDNIGKLYASS